MLRDLTYLLGRLAAECHALGGEKQTNDSADRTLIVECFGGLAVLASRDAPALSPRLGPIARHEHARRSIEISTKSFGCAPHDAPAHAPGRLDP